MIRSPFRSISPSRPLALALLLTPLLAPLVPAPAQAWGHGGGWGWGRPARPVGVAPGLRPANPWAYGDGVDGGDELGSNVDGLAAPRPIPAAPTAEELAVMAQRCNTGRLVGGLVGGGIGYAASRQDGRAWAIPLGALLGSQVGCNAAAGRAPTPW